MQALDCTAFYINNYLYYGYHSQCQIVKEACEESDAFMFLDLYYCGINHSTLMLFILAAIIVFIAFNLLSSTAEAYLSPAVTNLSEKLNLSETVAGVTLVAMGNGAPDCLVAITSASKDDEDGISFTIGSIFGAGLFICTMCIGLVIEKAGGKLQPNKIMFMRDLIFYFIATAIILIFAWIGTISLLMAISFMGLYVVYIIVVILLEIKYNKEIQAENDQIEENESKIRADASFKSLNQNQSQLNKPLINYKADQEKQNLLNVNHDENDSDKDLNQEIQYHDKQLNAPVKIEINKSHYKKVEHPNNLNLQNQQSLDSIDSSKKTNQRFLRTKHRLRQKYFKVSEQWKDMDFMDKITYIWEIPADFLRDITICPAEENWNKYRAMASLVFGPVFFLFTGTLPDDLFDPEEDWVVLLILAGIGLFLSVLVWKTAHTQKAPSYCWIFSILAFVFSIGWINLIADFLIQFLTFVQIITEINKVFLGMTFLAIGNSLADYFTNGQLSAMGFGNMGITACYSGQLFNLLVGFGLSLVIKASSGDIDFDLFGQNQSGLNISDKLSNSLGYLIVFAALIMVTFMILYSLATRFEYEKKIVLFLRILYLIVMVGCMGIAIASDITEPDLDPQNV